MENTTCGIYKITNLVNGKIYIGSSINLDRRLYEHKHSRNKTTVISKAISKYGVDKFQFEVIEICAETILIDRENYYIDLFRTLNSDIGYNLIKAGENPMLGRFHKIDKDTGETIKEWESLSAVMKFLNRKLDGSGGIRSVCKGKQKTAHGFKWEYIDLDKVRKFPKKLK